MSQYKAHFLETASPAYPEDLVVGESWEFSLDPSFPSRTVDGRLVSTLLREEAKTWLGRHHELLGTPILVKLLDAKDVLSVQVHPRDDDPWLKPHESGKPEAWVILDADEDAALWLGLSENASPDQVREAMENGEDLRFALNRVPVRAGDSFIISPGVVHAVGKGVTLLEPQLVYPGKTGVTYRFWDWGRLYDAEGKRHPEGQPRPLHKEEALLASDWNGLRGDAFVSSVRASKSLLQEEGGLKIEKVLDLGPMRLLSWSGRGKASIPAYDTLLIVTVTEGHWRVLGKDIPKGQSAIVPAKESLLIEGEGMAFVSFLR